MYLFDGGDSWLVPVRYAAVSYTHLLPEFTALENVMIPAFIAGVGQKEATASALELLEFMGLTDRAGHKANELSGGEKQRVAVEMCIRDTYEGPYCKYRNANDNAGKAADNTRAEKYLRDCVSACEALMAKGYSLNPSYQGNYNSCLLYTSIREGSLVISKISWIE